MKRSSGVLLPISSLPAPYGIGTFGRTAYEFVDFLKKAGQRYWQILPLGPTSYGDSPYQSFSSSAGNPYFIDLDLLIEDGLLTKEEVSSRNWGTEPRYVDYGKLYENRYWGDPGYIQICFDVRNMDSLEAECKAAGHPFVCDSGVDFDMGDAGGHFTYIEDPDGTLIEFVETFRIPVVKKIGFYLDFRKRDDRKPLPRWMLKALRFLRVS